MGCPDFERVTDDPLDFECTCGHVEDEHEASGFFRSCLVCGDGEEE